MFIRPNLRTLFSFFKDRSTLAAMAADMYAIIGVVFLQWNPFRIIGFYWLDICVAAYLLLAWIFFLNREEINFISVGTALLSAFFVGAFLLIYLNTILAFPNELTQRGPSLSLSDVFYPYFDISIFLVFSVISHIFRLKKLSAVSTQESIPFHLISTVSSLSMIPLMLIGGGYLGILTGQIGFSLVVALVICRNILEYWRFGEVEKLLWKAKESPKPVINETSAL